MFLNFKKITIFFKYFNFINDFLFNFIVELSKYIGINNYSINLVNNK